MPKIMFYGKKPDLLSAFILSAVPLSAPSLSAPSHWLPLSSLLIASTQQLLRHTAAARRTFNLISFPPLLLSQVSPSSQNWPASACVTDSSLFIHAASSLLLHSKIIV